MSRSLGVGLLSLAVLGALASAWLVLSAPPGGYSAAPTAAGAEPSGEATTPLRANGVLAGDQRESLPAESTAAQHAHPEDALEAKARFAAEIAVLDPEGAPIEGASVRSLSGRSQAATTDEQGLARFVLPARTRFVELAVDAEGFMHARDSWRAAERIEVTLRRSTSARGRVVEKGTLLPLRGATVWLEDGHRGCEPVRGPVGPDGSFELAEVPLGASFSIAAASDGFADGRVTLRLLPGADTEEVRLELERSAALRLQFVDFLTQRPLPGVRVTSLPDLPTSDERGMLDASRLAGLSSPTLWIRASAPGYCRLLRHVQAAEWSEGSMATVPLVAGARFEGHVRDASGRPLEGARVELFAQDGLGRRLDSSMPSRLPGWRSNWMLSPESDDSVESDASGYFSTPGVPPDAAVWRLAVSAVGHAPQVVDPGPSGEAGRATWVEVALAPVRTGTIRGRLTLNGAPTAGQVAWRSGGAEGSGSADPTGVFALEGVEPGLVELRAVPADGTQRFGELCADQVVSAELAPLAELEQDVALTLVIARTQGSVRTARGEPVAGAEVRASLRARNASLRTRTGQDGRFELELPSTPERWTVAGVEPWRTEAVQASAGDADVALVVAEVGKLRVRLIDSVDGEPLRRLELRGRAPGEPSERTLATSDRNAPDPAGWIEVSAPSGPLDLSAVPRDPNYLQVRASVVVPPTDGEPLRLELATERGSALELALAEDSDRPPRRRQMYLLEEREARAVPAHGSPEERRRALFAAQLDAEVLRARRISFNPEGRTKLIGLRPGRYLLVDLGGGRFEPGAVELTRQAGPPLEVRWESSP